MRSSISGDTGVGAPVLSPDGVEDPIVGPHGSATRGGAQSAPRARSSRPAGVIPNPHSDRPGEAEVPPPRVDAAADPLPPRPAGRILTVRGIDQLPGVVEPVLLERGEGL